MSYARFGYDSDVYVFGLSDGGFECCGCRLSEATLASQRFDDRQDLLLHLQDHKAAGHKVPPYAITRLQEELTNDMGDISRGTSPGT